MECPVYKTGKRVMRDVSNTDGKSENKKDKKHENVSKNDFQYDPQWEYDRKWQRHVLSRLGYPVRSMLKQEARLGRDAAPLKNIREIDKEVILYLHDVKHMFKLSTDDEELCFCVNTAFEVLLFGGESHKCRDTLMTWFIVIMSKKGFYKCLKNNGVE